MKNRVKILFEILVDQTLEVHLTDLEKTFVNLKELVQNRYELLNRAAHQHADYDQRFQRLSDGFSALQRTFDQLKQTEFSSDLFVKVQVKHRSNIFSRVSAFSKNFQLDCDDFADEFQRLISVEEEVLRQTSSESGEQMKVKSKQLTQKWRQICTEIQLFRVRSFVFSSLSSRFFFRRN